ncbi:MAG: BACON domain-containing protein [Bacteroidales bacterium]|nr:BACON domain-containing protein [Bacteroidales bacterium]
MKIKSFLFSALAFAACVACQEKASILTPSQVSLDPLIIKVSADGETKTAALTANCDWEVSGPAWAVVEPASGTGNTTISIIVSANDGKERDGEVVVTAKDAKSTAKLLVVQSGVAAVDPGPGPGPGPDEPQGTTIKTAEQLAAFITDAPTLAAGEEWTVEADIDCGGTKISPIASFSAILDGKGHKIYNFVVESADSKAGLVITNNGTIKNIVFGSSDGKTYDGKSSISFVDGGSGDYAGLVADNAGVLENVTSFVTVNFVAPAEKSSDYMGLGGIAGTASGSGSFVNCTNGASLNASGTLVQEMGIGGILGYTQSSDVRITSCVNVANLTINVPIKKVVMIGGIAGRTNGTIVIDKCENKGEIAYDQAENPSTWMAIGGIGGVFYNGITITNCKNSGRISSNLQQVTRAGGILATLNRGGLIQGCENSGEVVINQAEANANWQAAGGIVGSQEREDAAPAVVKGNTNTGKVTITMANNTTAHQNRVSAGGILGIGTLFTEVSGNTNKGAVSIENKGTADSWAGGVIGAMVSTTNDYPTAISANVNEGAVSCKTSDDVASIAGGVIGNNGYYPTKTDNTKITLTGDKNTGAVTCANVGKAGSIAGYNLGTLTNCVAGGSVNGTKLDDANFATLIQGAASSGTATGTTLAK